MEPPDDLNLTESERSMWGAMMAGVPCDFGDGDPRQLDSPCDWGPERTIRGHVLARLLLLLGATRSQVIRRIRIRGARVTGGVDLNDADVVVAMHFDRCLFENDLMLGLAHLRSLRIRTCVLTSIDATGSSIEGLLTISQSKVQRSVFLADATVSHSARFSGSTIVGDCGRALTADRLKVGGSVFLRDGFDATGEVRLLDAQINGKLECVRGHFKNPTCHAINADGAEIRGGVFLQDGFHATGEVRLLGARIVGELNGSGGRFDNPCRIALNADRAEIGGGVFLVKLQGHTDGFHARGEVRLLGARIGAALICSGGKFENPQSVALGLDNADVNGDMRLDAGFDATGEVRLLGARITGQLNCANGRFKNRSGDALVLDGGEIGGSVFFCKRPDCTDNFHATGVVRLPYARIAGQLNCSGGLFDNSKGYALIANNAEIRGGVFLCKLTDGAARFHAKGEVNLQQARIVGQLSCHGGEFDNSRGAALTADGADIRGDAQLTDGFHATGEVRLLGTRISDQLNCSDGTFENSKGTALNLQEARANSLWLRNLRPHSAWRDRFG